MQQVNIKSLKTQNENNPLNLNDSRGSKVLLIYPTLYRVTGLPIGIASLSAALKDKGFEVKIFDTAFYKFGPRDQEDIRADNQMTKPITNMLDYWEDKPNELLFDLHEIIKNYKPNIIGISILEDTYDLSYKMTRSIKSKYPGLPIVIGGIFPTLSPEIFVNESSIDHICIGEGEISFPILCEKIINDEEFCDVRGFWVKKGRKIYRNPPAILPNINELPFPDYSAFDESLLLKPMQGKMYKMLSIEASRGCVHKCTYCENSLLGDFYNQSGSGRYYRKMDMTRIIEQINYQVEKYNCDFIYFASEYFLALSNAEFETFIEGYRKIKIPFYFQTRFETVKGDRLKLLKEVGMSWLSVALEHGNENFRRKYLSRRYSNDTVVKAIETLKEHDIGATIQNMMGLPFENRELIFDTINFCKELYRNHNNLQFNIYMFNPYRSCALYETCVKEGLLRKEWGDYIGNVFDGNSPLLFTEKYKKELSELYRTFNLYVKLPDEYLPQIKIAGKDDDEGRQMFAELSKKIGLDRDRPNANDMIYDL